MNTILFKECHNYSRNFILYIYHKHHILILNDEITQYYYVARLKNKKELYHFSNEIMYKYVNGISTFVWRISHFSLLCNHTHMFACRKNNTKHRTHKQTNTLTNKQQAWQKNLLGKLNENLLQIWFQSKE